MTFDHNVSNKVSIVIKIVSCFTMKITWEELLIVLEYKEILGGVPIGQGLPLTSSIKFWVLKKS